MSANAAISGATLTAARLAAIAGSGAGSVVATGTALARAAADMAGDVANVFQFATPDRTGATDCSAAILAAYTAASALGYRVLYFPKGTYYAPTLAGCGNMIFIGEGVLVGAYNKLIFPAALGTRRGSGNDVTPSQHMAAFNAAVARATPSAPAILVCTGDSTTTNTQSSFSSGEWFVPLMQEVVNKQYGPKATSIAVIGRGVGGQTWTDLDGVAHSNWPGWYSPQTAQWMSFIMNVTAGLSTGPDGVVINLGMNDQLNFDPVRLQSVLAKIQAGPKPVSILFVINYVPSSSIQVATQSLLLQQQAREYPAGYQRTYAEKNGYGVIDFNEEFHLQRDGILVNQQWLNDIQTNQAVSLPYTFPQACTDFDLGVTFPSTPWVGGQIIVQIGNNAGNTLILDKDTATGNVAYTVNATSTLLSVPRTVSAFPTNVGYFLGVCCKGGLMTVVVGGNQVCSIQVERFGGPFQPTLTVTGTGAPTTATIANASVGVPLTSMPMGVDVDFFGSFALSGGIHMNAWGIETVMRTRFGQTRLAG